MTRDTKLILLLAFSAAVAIAILLSQAHAAPLTSEQYQHLRVTRDAITNLLDNEDQCQQRIAADHAQRWLAVEQRISELQGQVNSLQDRLLHVCSTGPALPLTPGCEEFDRDCDGDVDMDDFGLSQRGE